MTSRNKPFSTGTWSRKKSPSTLLSVHYEDGSTAYFEADRNLMDDDRTLISSAQDRQIKGELPDGSILAVKRVR